MTGEVGFVCGAGLLKGPFVGFLNFSSSLRLQLTNLEAYGTGQTWQRTTSTKS